MYLLNAAILFMSCGHSCHVLTIFPGGPLNSLTSTHFQLAPPMSFMETNQSTGPNIMVPSSFLRSPNNHILFASPPSLVQWVPEKHVWYHCVFNLDCSRVSAICPSRAKEGQACKATHTQRTWAKLLTPAALLSSAASQCGKVHQRQSDTSDLWSITPNSQTPSDSTS